MKKSKVIISILSIIVVVETALIVYSAIFTQPFFGFDMKTVRPYDNFIFKNELICEVVHSTRDSGKGIVAPWLDMREIRLRGLTTNNPEMQWYTGDWTPLNKTFEGDTYIVFASPLGSYSNTFLGIYKTNGSFVYTDAAPQGGVWWAHYAVAQKGRCR